MLVTVLVSLAPATILDRRRTSFGGCEPTAAAYSVTSNTTLSMSQLPSTNSV